MLEGVKHVILVLSGKGGVGKSTVSVQLAHALRARGKKVGMLDIDLCGPSLPRMLHMEGTGIHQGSGGWVPVFADEEQKLSVMSIGFLLEGRDDAVIWRGPKKNAMIKQFLEDVLWGELDYLVIDTPPGTSDEHITVLENLKKVKRPFGLLVTTPQALAVGDVRREHTFCQKAGVELLGVIENMSGYVCPHCTECTNIFSSGGGEALAQMTSIPFLGRLPIDPALTTAMEEGDRAFIETHQDSEAVKTLLSVADAVIARTIGVGFHPGSS